MEEYIINTTIIVGIIAYYLHRREMKKKNNEIENLKKNMNLKNYS